MEKFVGKVVVVTGACGGIGRDVAMSFGEAGAALALCDIRQQDLAILVEELNLKRLPVLSSAIDVTKEDQVQEFCDLANQKLGGIDCLINTVGRVDNMGDVETLSLSYWARTIDINLTSAFLMAKYAAPRMRARGGGSIINISSVSGMANQAGAMVYSVTKAGLISLTKSEAIDLAKYNIRANAICPGSVETPLLDQAIELTARENGRTPAEQRVIWASQYPSLRFSKPSDISELALFLCSERASNITGASLVVDGGLTALLPER